MNKKQTLSYKDFCAAEEAEDTYRTLFDHKEWPPAQNVRNSIATPTAFGNVASDGTAGITKQRQVLNLIQNKPCFNAMALLTKPPGTCNKCGKPGHGWAKEYPDGKQTSANPRTQRNSCSSCSDKQLFQWLIGMLASQVGSFLMRKEEGAQT